MTIEEFIQDRLDEDEQSAPNGDDPETWFLRVAAYRAALRFHASLTESDQNRYVDLVLRPFAAIWAAHPDYRYEWAVDGGGSKP
ncbi:hypothetical protein [Nocardia sp. NBC_01327]|uniref:hypothetical protein n=1 Tax=Nocardia sp. NBC_01327 TaxID=2903593 RepID=UPI002E113FA3|nr:hypothetical protein OG326_23580 [Nocardia sp. NBC_01327]